MPLQIYLSAIALAINEVKGKNALAFSRDLGTSYKTSFVLMHKIREALGSEMKGARVGGEGETVEIDVVLWRIDASSACPAIRGSSFGSMRV